MNKPSPLVKKIIARDIDVRNACFVINVGSPNISEKESDIDLDIYLHQVGLTGRHKDHGVTQAFVQEGTLNIMVEGMKKIHNIEISEMKDPVKQLPFTKCYLSIAPINLRYYFNYCHGLDGALYNTGFCSFIS